MIGMILGMMLGIMIAMIAMIVHSLLLMPILLCTMVFNNIYLPTLIDELSHHLDSTMV
jgi:hypothetical protein